MVRPIAKLEREVVRVERLCEESDYVAFGDLLAPLLLELHAAAVDPDGEVRTAATRLLARACQSAFYLLKDLGYHDLAWIAADRAGQAAEASELADLVGLSMFLRSHALRAVGARSRAVATARRGDRQDAVAGTPRGVLGRCRPGPGSGARQAGRGGTALRRAEALAPLQVRANPYVRETVADLRNRGAGRELRDMARRMGLE